MRMAETFESVSALVQKPQGGDAEVLGAPVMGGAEEVGGEHGIAVDGGLGLSGLWRLRMWHPCRSARRHHLYRVLQLGVLGRWRCGGLLQRRGLRLGLDIFRVDRRVLAGQGGYGGEGVAVSCVEGGSTGVFSDVF